MSLILHDSRRLGGTGGSSLEELRALPEVAVPLVDGRADAPARLSAEWARCRPLCKAIVPIRARCRRTRTMGDVSQGPAEEDVVDGPPISSQGCTA